MTSYRSYLSCIPSGLDWLGEIPNHWQTVTLHHVGRLKSGESITALQFDTDGEYPVYGRNGFRGNCERFTHNGNYVLIGRQGALCGNINIAKGKFFASEHAIVVNPVWLFDTHWMGYQLQSMDLNQYSVSAAQPGLSAEVIGRLKICFPPVEEQKAIACFLDFKTEQIDALIAKKKTLLEKLAEKRIAIISHAVTKGLDPSVPMKDSGVDWLGEIPESWKTTRIKFLGSLLLGLTYSPDDVVSDGGTLVLRSSNVQDGRLDLTDCVYVSCDIPQKILTKPDDILICSRNGSRALIGKCALLTEEVARQTFGAFMTVLRSRHARFLYYVLNSTLFKFQSGRFLTSTINQLTTQTLGDFEIALPPEDEQEAIVSHLDTVTEAIDQQASKVQQVLDRLTEYRSALITNAVTGKIDVRGFRPPLNSAT